MNSLLKLIEACRNSREPVRCSTGHSSHWGINKECYSSLAFSHLGHPQKIKTDNGLGYITQATQAFLEKWRIWHKTDIPYNPTGQAIVERAHQTFKTLLSI